jgi:hypothetical protein
MGMGRLTGRSFWPFVYSDGEEREGIAGALLDIGVVHGSGISMGFWCCDEMNRSKSTSALPGAGQVKWDQK